MLGFTLCKATRCAVALSVVFFLACSDDDNAAGPCESTTLQNTVAASPWAGRVAGIVSYRYRADLAAGATEVDLLDAQGTSLGTMRVWQSYGASDVADGSMVAELGALRLTTRGYDLDAKGYLVRSELEAEDKKLTVDARFSSRPCFSASSEVAPPCAANLPLDRPVHLLFSCGLVSDLYLLADSAPVLSRLDYSAAAVGGATPAVGGFARGVEGDRITLSLLAGETLQPQQDIEAWLKDAGLEALSASDDLSRLNAAFLDRAWWREVEKHVAFCAAPTGAPESKTSALKVGSREQASTGLCAGQQNAKDWDQGSSKSSSGSSSNVRGDPHLLTLDGHSYDFQGRGEFTLVRADDASFAIQARFEIGTGEPPFAPCKDVTWATAVATEIGGYRVSIHSRPSAVFVDDKPIESLDQLPTLDGGEITISRHEAILRWASGEILRVGRSNTLTLFVTLPASRRGAVNGLLGNFNGDESDDLALATGESYALPIAFDALYGDYAESWRVTPSTSLFHYGAEESTATFAFEGFPAAPARPEDLPDDARASAEASCRDEGVNDPQLLAGCIIDVACASSSDEADALAKAAGDDAPPLSASRPGEEGLASGLSLRHVDAPASAEGQSPPTPERCQLPQPRWLLAFAEAKEHTLSNDLDLDISEPGSWDDPGSWPAGTLPAGSSVDSYLIHRDPDGDTATPLEGWVRFAQPIVGVIVSGTKLDASDATLGAPTTTYARGAARGLEAGDMLRLSSDGKTLWMRLGGADLDHVRVLTEVK